MIDSRWTAQIAGALFTLGACAPAGADVLAATDLADLSIEELANIQITSVSRKPEPLAGAAASVFVITADDIRRAGATSLADALRLAPNLQVANINGSTWAISARGLNGTTGSQPNKLLVLIDGRSVYTPFYSGVFWDQQDTMLEDIERIEVISGPGGTLWGVNAVNGVINITTKAARDTRGSLLSVALGERGAELAFRQGGDGWRVFGKGFSRTHTETAAAVEVDDGWRQGQVGFRRDWERGGDQFSVNGNVYRGVLDQPKPGSVQITGVTLVLDAIRTEGANLTGQWVHPLDGGGSVSTQAYFDHSWRKVPPAFEESLDVLDLQVQHSLPLLGRHSVVWGANVRHSWDHVTNGPYLAFLPGKLQQNWFSLFGQDDIALRDDLKLTIGNRFEHNDYTGLEVLPTLRLAWKPAIAQMLWAGASRTVRAPARQDVDTFVPGVPPYLLRGGQAVVAEVANVFELGYRAQPTARLSFSATAFHNRYNHLRTQEIDVSRRFVVYDSKLQGQANGLELWGNFQAATWWRLSAGLSALHETLHLKAGSNDTTRPATTGRDPAHTAQLRSSFSLADDKDLDVAVRKVGALNAPVVPAYTALDARFGWKLRAGMELSLIGQNLNGGHAEYGPLATRSEIPRALAVRLVWQQ